MGIKDIIGYSLAGLLIWFMLWLLNGLVILPMLINYYVKTKKEPSKIIAWYLFKTTSPTMFMVSSIIWYLIPVLYKGNKKRKKYYGRS